MQESRTLEMLVSTSKVFFFVQFLTDVPTDGGFLKENHIIHILLPRKKKKRTWECSLALQQKLNLPTCHKLESNRKKSRIFFVRILTVGV